MSKEINLYKVTVTSPKTGFGLPVSSFITIAESIGNAEENIITYLKGKGEVTSVCMLRDSYSFQEGDYYVTNKKQN